MNGENVRVVNSGGFVMKAALRWTDQNGQTQESSGDTGELALGQYAILGPGHNGGDNWPQQGASCWMVAYVRSGPTHESGDNFTWMLGCGAQVVYGISGSVFNPSWSLDDQVNGSWET